MKTIRIVIVAFAIVMSLSKPGYCHQDSQPELYAVEHGVTGIENFIKSGGKFTGQKNEVEQTAAMIAASSNADVINAFIKAGGRFTNEKDIWGREAEMYVVDSSPGRSIMLFGEHAKAIEAFAAAGGMFNDDADNEGLTAALKVVENPEAIPAFVKAGGHFNNQRSKYGYTVGMFAVMAGAKSIEAFTNAGGKFTAQQVGQKTAEDMAKEKGNEVLDAYKKAVIKQGGVLPIKTDDEFFVLDSPASIQSFLNNGGKFDNEFGPTGETAAMIAAYKGPDVMRAFVAGGGKFTTQRDSRGYTAADIVKEYENTQGPGELVVYNEAVKKQGGLAAVASSDEYAAAKIGASGIKAFSKAGGVFTDEPNSDGLTSGMIACSMGPEAISAYALAGGHFSDYQNKDGFSAAMVAALYGADALRAFTKAGGHFTDQQDNNGTSVGMFVVMDQDPDDREKLGFSEKFLEDKGGLLNVGAEAIKAFADGGGKFTDQVDSQGDTAAMHVVWNRDASAISAFVAAGGKFTDQQNKDGSSAAMLAAMKGNAQLKAYALAGGKFTNQKDKAGMTAAMYVASNTDEHDIGDEIKTFSESGGVFTDQKNAAGWTAEMMVKDLGGYLNAMVKSQSRKNESKEDKKEDEFILSMKQPDFTQRNIIATKAYKDAVIKQGGLKHVE